MGHEIGCDLTDEDENDLVRLSNAGTASDAPTVGAGLAPPAPVAARARAIFKGVYATTGPCESLRAAIALGT